MKSTVAIGAAFVASASAALYPGLSPDNHTCIIKPAPLSCPPPSSSSYDTCCAETYGGLVLQTQFWNTYTGLESQGQLIPPNTWTIHGLWPDFCNGSYTQYCDLSRQYDPSPSPNTTNGLANGTVVPPYTGPSISTFITDFGRYDLLEYMNKYWINQGAPNSDFWAHEFSKHATCYSSFQIPCYGPKYVNHSDVIDFFDTVIEYYKRFPTFAWLQSAGIVPSNKTQVSLSDVQGTLTKYSGAIPYVGCSGPRYNTTAAGMNSTDSGRTVISEVWYYNNVYGRVQNGQNVHVNATSPSSSCATTEGALWYYEPTTSSLQKY